MRNRLFGTTAVLALLSAPAAHAQICTSPNCTAGASGVVDAATSKATGSTAERALSARAADTVNMVDYGAVMTGTTDDGGAANLARAKAGYNGTIFVPPGGFNLSSFTAAPTNDTAVRLWLLSGNTYANAGPTGVPVNSVGYDEVESMINGGKFFGKNNPNEGSPTLRIDGNYASNNTSDTAAATSQTFIVNATLTGPPTGPTAKTYPTNDVWVNLTQLNDYSVGNAQNVGIAVLSQHPVDALKDGQGPRAEMWASNFVAQSYDGAPASKDGSLIGLENDMYAGDDDEDNGGNSRIAIHDIASKSYSTDHEMRAKWAILLGTGTGSRWGRGFAINGQWDTAAFDSSQGVSYKISYSTSVTQSAVGQTMTIPVTGGIRTGMIVTGANIPVGDWVTAVTRETYADNSVQGAAPTAPGTVTLAVAPTSAEPSGTALTFDSMAPAVQLVNSQRVCFDTNTASPILGKECAKYNLTTGQIEWRDGPTDVTPFLAYGKLAVTINTGLSINSGMSVTGTSLFNTEADFAGGGSGYVDPEPNVSRALKISGTGIAWSGGAYGDALAITGASVLSGGLNVTGASVFNTETGFGGGLADAEPGVARDIKANTNGIAFLGGLYGDTMQVLGSTVAPASAALTIFPANCGTTIRDFGTTAHTYTVPTGLPTGCLINVIQAGTGAITFAAGSGEVAEQLGTNTTHTTSGQFATAVMFIDSASTFLVRGQVQ